ncbi:MAG: type II toxin-antitoxin system VapC family toxin [Actinomycetota bacterium]|nr:type II toxin-antitoxin system VapC family toxin [Actinomycetota bacterium]
MFDEEGSELAAELWDRAESVVSSQLIYPEARAAMAAAQRGRRITSATLRRAVAAIDGFCAELEIIGLDPELARTAGDLAEAHGLRGYDAVHLATAMSIDMNSMLLATWDGDLARAGVAAGRSVSPPPPS